MSKKALFVLAEGYEEGEVIIPADLLRRAGVDVTIAGLAGLTVTGSHKIMVMADALFENIHGDFDALVLHGGNPGAQNLAISEKLRSLIEVFYKHGKIVAGICAAPAVVLAPTGILNGKKVCGFPGTEGLFPKSATVLTAPVVVDGKIITSRGFGTAIPFGLALIEQLVGKEMRDKIAKAIVWEP
jgi:protein deglycase